jgi:hypothetical protein
VTRPRHGLVALGVLLAGALLVGALVVGILAVTASSRDATAPQVRLGALLTPRTPLFGDTVTAQVEFAGDARRIVPGSVRVQGDFAPFRKIAKPVLVRKVAGDAEYVVWTARLRCLDRRCVPGKADTRVTFPRARVTYALRAGARGKPNVERSLSVRWPALVVYSRIDPIEVQASDPRDEPPWRADLASLLDVTYRTPPTATAAAAFGLSALLGLGALLLAAPLRRRREEPAPLDDELRPAPASQTPLELALSRLENPSEEADAEPTRRALELVARELYEHGQTELPVGAQRLAWSAEAPGGDESREVAESARRAFAERADADGEGEAGADA